MTKAFQVIDISKDLVKKKLTFKFQMFPKY